MTAENPYSAAAEASRVKDDAMMAFEESVSILFYAGVVEDELVALLRRTYEFERECEGEEPS